MSLVLFDLQASWNLFVFNIACYILIVVVQRHIDVWLPEHVFNPSHRRYKSFRWERNGDFYRDVLRIDLWKDKLPCLTGLTHFSKKNLANHRVDYLEQFVVETCRAESNHWTAIGSVIVMRLWTPFDLWLVCFVIAFVGNLPFICIQRYNRPRLERTLQNIEQRSIAGAGYQPRAIEARPSMTDQRVVVDQQGQPEPHLYTT